jgi:hypothetical protein
MRVFYLLFLTNSNRKKNCYQNIFSPSLLIIFRDQIGETGGIHKIKTLLWLHNLWAETPQKRKNRPIFPVFDWLGMKCRVTQVSRLFCPIARQLHRVDHRHPPTHNATFAVLRDARRWISWVNILRYVSRKLMLKPNYGRGWRVLLWPRLRTVGFHKMQTISLLPEGIRGFPKTSKFLETVTGIFI